MKKKPLKHWIKKSNTDSVLNPEKDELILNLMQATNFRMFGKGQENTGKVE